LLWPEYDQLHARGTLRRTLSALGKALDGEQLSIERESIGLRADTALRLDVDEFHRLLAACRTHGHTTDEACAACVEPLATAAALYRDDFMAGFSLRDSPAWDDWQFFQRETLRRELASVLRRLTGAYIGLARYDDAISSARRWLALDPLHEPAHRSLMRLYAWSGQRAAALRQYQTCARALDRELGVAPLEATTRLYDAIKQDRLAPPPAPARSALSPAPRSAEARSASSLRDQEDGGSTSATPSPREGDAGIAATVRGRRDAAGSPSPRGERGPGGVDPAQLVGRAEEWKTLCDAYEAIGDSGRVVVLAGEAGIGKTRLAEEFTANARANGGAAVIATRCYDGEASLAYAPLIAALRAALAQDEIVRRLAELPDRWLAEAARLAPEIARVRPGQGLPPAPPLEGPGAQGQFFEGLRQVLLAACRGPKPGILLFDDVQWADSASLDVLAYLARRLHGAPLCLLLTWRPSEAPGRSRIRQLVAEGQRAGSATLITLSRLDADAVRELLLARLPGAQTPADMPQRLYEETEGVPFFVVEYLSALSQGNAAAVREPWSLPGGIRELLHSRLRAVEGTSAQVLAAAAVIGRWFDFETLRAVSGRGEEETIAALEELLARGLIRELAASAGPLPAYDFSHEKLRSQVYDEISLARRRLLHRRVAEALSASVRRQRDGNGLLGQIA
ncbi:MAG TPA: AAA family ATPase, partial [Ktedonobacterales bacterium]|nr:AAA family ATPase [Ktedonobacterales bacterium]